MTEREAQALADQLRKRFGYFRVLIKAEPLIPNSQLWKITIANEQGRVVLFDQSDVARQVTDLFKLTGDPNVPFEERLAKAQEDISYFLVEAGKALEKHGFDSSQYREAEQLLQLAQLVADLLRSEAPRGGIIDLTDVR